MAQEDYDQVLRTYRDKVKPIIGRNSFTIEEQSTLEDWLYAVIPFQDNLPADVQKAAESVASKMGLMD